MHLKHSGHSTHILTRAFPAGSGIQPILLIHGAANDAEVWLDVIPHLVATGHPVIAPDLPGHGLSKGVALNSVEAIADWVAGLLATLEVGPVFVIGHSMGSLVALEMACRHPDRIARLALIGSTTPMPVSPTLLETARQTPDTACRMVMGWSHTPTFFRQGGPGHGVWGPGKTLAIMRRNQRTLATDLANCNAYLNGLEAAGQVACPTLLVVGKKDRMTPPRMVQPLQESLRNVSRVDLAGCGHAMMAEAPAALAKALIVFAGTGRD